MAERAFTHAEIEPQRVRGVGMAAAYPRSPVLHRRINEVMRAGRQGRTAGEEIPFFCECERTDCFEPIWLTVAAYDERRTEAQRPLTLPDHDNGRAEEMVASALLRELSSQARRMGAPGKAAKNVGDVAQQSAQA